MSTLTALIPRLRYRTGRVVSIGCSTCRKWRKPRHFSRNTNTCHTCVYDANLAARRRHIAALSTKRG